VDDVLEDAHNTFIKDIATEEDFEVGVASKNEKEVGGNRGYGFEWNKEDEEAAKEFIKTKLRKVAG
jgi:hypothetical protein